MFKRYENGVVPPTFMGCTYLPTPQSFNPVCNVNKMRGLNLPFNGFIVYNENGTNTTCYRDMPVAENHGWCAVCSVHNGESDDENSCEYEGIHTPELDKGWGFCSDSCTFPDEELLGTSLQETSITVFSNEQCYSLNNNTWTFNPKLELCGSHIWRRKGVYMRRNHDKDAEKEYETTPIVEELIGAADACQGDSGGPMVTHEDPSNPGKSVLVGIVSRGKGCGQTGQTAIYTRVSAFYNWIVDTIKADKEKYWKCTD
ncbi:uncharacterized protein LOC111716820 [Eurytemora carolleeae]|uniref:uncharacterized protein LOC111716820 n=1 Tax=Eurytemora carolleeae TaxID=1294199 RepID=UPI000C765EA0|nr:uncharacterized protein LOC111716820 [Eurytemora carolleeae]|eukprot:XP_023348081.1 uncharacterized protein LOC111716820 [Eurytemora affinis]